MDAELRVPLQRFLVRERKPAVNAVNALAECAAVCKIDYEIRRRNFVSLPSLVASPLRRIPHRCLSLALCETYSTSSWNTNEQRPSLGSTAAFGLMRSECANLFVRLGTTQAFYVAAGGHVNAGLFSFVLREKCAGGSAGRSPIIQWAAMRGIARIR